MERFNKATVAGLALALVAGLQLARDSLALTETQRSWVSIVLVVVGTAATYLVPNKPTAPDSTALRQ